jgi:hypothetical protein
VTSRLPFLALAILAGCSSAERAAPDAARLTALPSPAGPRSGEPFLASDTTGAVHMTWIERTGDSTHAVRYARLDGDTWSQPTTVVERRDLFVNWADYPSVIATPSGRLLVHWLQRSGAGRYAYEVRIAQSTDRGATWSEGSVLHSDRSPGEHGFVATWLAPGDSVGAAWLDGRRRRSWQGCHEPAIRVGGAERRARCRGADRPPYVRLLSGRGDRNAIGADRRVSRSDRG